MRFITILLAALWLAGCAEFMASGSGLELLEKAAEKGGAVEDATLGNAMKVLPKYCANVPAVGRRVLRDRANDRPEAGGAKLAIYCPGDEPLVLGP